jgi:hypothetical protein
MTAISAAIQIAASPEQVGAVLAPSIGRGQKGMTCRGRLHPSITPQRWWQAWSDRPPPPQLQALISSGAAGHGLRLYIPN